jgi:hypothetical protein
MAESNTLEIIRGIAQAAANSYDGAHDEKYSYDGEARKVGLNREEGDIIIDSRKLDGFSVRFEGPMLYIHYHGEIKVKDVHNVNKFESEIEAKINDVAKYLKKEYKKVTSKSLSLTAEGELNIDIQSTSRVRAWVQACRYYKIGGLSDVEKGPGQEESSSEDRIDDSIKKFLAIGKDSYPGTKKPKNVTRKGE